jgi:hypothetical protein
MQHRLDDIAQKGGKLWRAAEHVAHHQAIDRAPDFVRTREVAHGFAVDGHRRNRCAAHGSVSRY